MLDMCVSQMFVSNVDLNISCAQKYININSLRPSDAYMRQ